MAPLFLCLSLVLWAGCARAGPPPPAAGWRPAPTGPTGAPAAGQDVAPQPTTALQVAGPPLRPEDVVSQIYAIAHAREKGPAALEAVETLVLLQDAKRLLAPEVARKMGNSVVSFGNAVYAISTLLSVTEVCELMERLLGLQKKHRAFARFFTGPGAVAILALVWHAAAQGPALTGSQAARLMWVLGKAEVTNPEVYKHLTNHLVKCCKLRSVSPPDISIALYALAKNQVRLEDFVGEVEAHVVAPGVAERFEAQAVSNTVWALATLQAFRPALLTALARRVRAPGFARSCSPQALANIAWAYATLDHQDEDLMEAIADAVQQPATLEALTPQHVGNLAWAYAKLRSRHHGPLLAALAERALRPGALDSFQPQNGANLAWAFATLQVKHPLLMDGLSRWAARPGLLQGGGPQAAANLVWAFAALGVADARLLAAVTDVVTQQSFLSKGQPQHFSMVLWAFATLGAPADYVLTAMIPRLLPGKFMSEFKAQELSNLAWALGIFNVRDSTLLDRVADAALSPRLQATLSPQHVVTLAWAMATLGHRHAELLASCERWAALRLRQPRCTAREVVTVAWASASLGRGRPELVDQVAQWAAQDPQRLQAFQDIANLAWSLAVVASMDDAALARLLGRFAALRQTAEAVPPQAFRQVHPLLLHVALHAAALPRAHQFLSTHEALRAECAAHFAAAASPTTPSAFHRAVATELRRFGLRFEQEVTLAEAGRYSVDLLLRDRRLVVEVDGPSHFVSTALGPQPSGGTALKHRQLRAFNFSVVSVPAHDWEPLTATERSQYLRWAVLGEGQGPAPGPSGPVRRRVSPAGPRRP